MPLTNSLPLFLLPLLSSASVLYPKQVIETGRWTRNDATTTVTSSGYVTTAHEVTQFAFEQYPVQVRSTLSSIRPVVTEYPATVLVTVVESVTWDVAPYVRAGTWGDYWPVASSSTTSEPVETVITEG